MSDFNVSVISASLEVQKVATNVVLKASPSLQENVLILDNIVFDFVSQKMWNVDHSGESAIKELWFESENYDTFAIMENGKTANYVQGDYPISAIELYYYDPAVTDKPADLAEVYQKCKRVALLDEPNKHYDILGIKWNVSIYYLMRGR